MRGKRLYKSSMLNLFRLILLALVLFFYHDFYLETFKVEKFIAAGKFGFLDVWRFNYRYPYELISLSIIILPPILYYGFFRGIRFYENGFLYNHGLPFFNTWIPWDNVKNYKLLHPELVMAIFTKTGDIYVVGDNRIERVIAIVDQHGIPGNLAQDEYVKLLQNAKKFFLVVATFTVALYIVKKMGWLAFYF